MIPLRRIPEVNFYKYPPPMPASEKDKLAFTEKLELSKRLAESEQFTIFVSVPYCTVRCNSCPYFKSLLPNAADQYSFLAPYVKSIETQLDAYSNTERFSLAKCAAVYMGGGTASLLSPEQVGRVVKSVKNAFETTNDIEITLEGNPADFGKSYYERIIQFGVNRLSIGYQSAIENILKDKLGSPHNAQEGARALNEAIGAGFRTVNVDMLYGIPGQRFEDWKSDLEIVSKLGSENITTNSYIIYGNTLSEHRIREGTLAKPINGKERDRWYNYTVEKLEKYGYIEYRKDTFSKPGHYQKYSELTYRLSKESVGIGAGSYSLINGYQFQSTSNPDAYMKNIADGIFTSPDSYSVKADKNIMMGRFVMQNLKVGYLSRPEFKAVFGNDPIEMYPEIFEEMQIKKLAEIDSDAIRLTDFGRKWQRSIMYAFYSRELRGNLR